MYHKAAGDYVEISRLLDDHLLSILVRNEEENTHNSERQEKISGQECETW
jgi:hypothetical protein